MEIRDKDGQWHRIASCFRRHADLGRPRPLWHGRVRVEQAATPPSRALAAQKPWTGSVFSKTRVMNPILACLAGRRNKMM